MTATMGLTHIEGVVTGPTGIARTVTFLVDSGAKYSLLPPDDWRAIRLAPRRRMTNATCPRATSGSHRAKATRP